MKKDQQILKELKIRQQSVITKTKKFLSNYDKKLDAWKKELESNLLDEPPIKDLTKVHKQKLQISNKKKGDSI